MIKSNLIKFVLPLILGLTILACNGDDSENESGTSANTVVDSLKAVSAEKIFYSIPSPIEMASILKASGSVYDNTLPNPVDRKDKYSTVRSRALNLGVYGADLSYAVVYDNTQESMLYLACAKKLADGLGITSAFSEEKIAKMEANMSNRDSMLALISDSYWETDAYLQENERGNVSAYIITGGWIEGIYLGCKIERKLKTSDKNKEIAKRIAEQKVSLDNLIALLESYASPDSFGDLIDDLKALQAIYATIKETESETTATANADGTTTIGGGSEFEINEEQLSAIDKKVTEIRNKITQP
ncbi:MAG: hypothetical protein KatS3mg027_1793 [Bacteroidia bacterium]|nr:MAG: hypothetical protein KatS3mg027_1793 [Bacteroidia bacterium]